MDAYMKMMAKKEAEREAKAEEEEERKRRSIPLLNETSFDRRKVSLILTSSQVRSTRTELTNPLPPFPFF